MSKRLIIIVGAGIAALTLAKKLGHMYHITILEASGRIGGRIHTSTEEPFTSYIENGAEFIHGDATYTKAILKEAGITYSAMEGKMYRVEYGKVEEEEEMIDGWDKLLKKMGSLEQDMTLAAFLNEYYAGDVYSELREQAIMYAGGFDLADADKASVQSLYTEWTNEGETYRIAGGYIKLIDYLASQCLALQCEIITNATVTNIAWEHGSVQVDTMDGRVFKSDKVILTIPVSLMQKQAINFTPTIDRHIAAFNDIGFGPVIKAVFEFHERIWKKDAGFFFSEQLFPTWWTQLPDERPLLTGWMGGSLAKEHGNKTDDELLAIANDAIAAILDIDKLTLLQHIKAAKVINWAKSEYALGGYSYTTPQSDEARKTLSLPINDTIYFAGEGLYNGTSPGTVEGAIVNAYSVADSIIDSF